MRLWRGVAESGLMVDVLSGLHAKLVNTLQGVELRSENGSLQETGTLPNGVITFTHSALQKYSQHLNFLLFPHIAISRFCLFNWDFMWQTNTK